MSDQTNILDRDLAWGSRPTRETIHVVDFDTDDPTRQFHDDVDRSLCGHWLEFDADEVPEPEIACVNCLRTGLSSGLLDPTWAMDALESATDRTQRGVEASPPS